MLIPITIEVEEQLFEKITTLAKDMERTLDEVVTFAFEDFHAKEREFTDDVIAGLKDLAEGRTVPHEEMVAWVNSLGTANPLPGPRAKVLEQASS